MIVCAYVVLAGRELTYKDSTGPGPGFFPLWVGGLGLLAGAGLLWTTAARGAQTDHDWTWPERAAGLRIVVTILAVVLAGLAMEPLGFRLTTFVFVGALLRVYGARATVALASAALCAVAVYFVFNTLLNVQLPRGILGF